MVVPKAGNPLRSKLHEELTLKPMNRQQPRTVASSLPPVFRQKHIALHRAVGVGRWLTYPKTPKMNAHVERFNGSLQNEFAAYHEDLLFFEN